MQPHLIQPPSPSDQSQTDPKLQQISRDDLKKIEKSMKKPEFMGLLNEYMIEISDPKNKVEYDEYLKQMQRQGQLPKHMKLVNLTAKFCFRTFIVSQKDKKHEMKFFINMCSCEYIEQPSCQPSSGEDGKIGFSWKIPNSMGKIRYDQDKRSNPCQTVDAAFHPDIFQFARKEQFQEMIINIALEAAEKQLGERKETLSKDYVILKKIKCKGNQPALLPIRYIDGKVYNKGQNKEGMERDTEGKQTKLQQQLNQQKKQYQKEKLQKNKEKEQDEENIQDNIQKQQEKEEISGIQRPKVSTIYTYPIDYSEFMQGPTMPKHKKIPSQFNIEFLLPRVQSMGEIDGQSLDLTENRLVLKVGDKYFIDLSFEQLKLKYPLQYENAKAKFDKKKRVLRVTIPIDQIKIKQQQQSTQVQSIENNKKQEQQQQLEQEIIQQQKWKDKNKLLQLSQQKVSNIVMDKIQLNQIKQQKQPLIQQIDQDDYIDQNDKNKLQQQQCKQQQQFIITKFTIKNYINQEQIYQKLNQINKLSFVFQENSNAIIIIVRVNHYNSDDIEINYDQSNYNQIMMVWNCRDKKSLLHLNVAEAWKHKINSVEVVSRVGFIVFICNKIDEEKGQFWQSSCIWDRVQQQNIDYGLFENTVEEIKAKNKQLQRKRQIQKQKEQQQLQQKIQQKQLKQQISNKQIQEQKINESQVINKIVQQKNQLSYKQQIQFINFDMSLIQILD